MDKGFVIYGRKSCPWCVRAEQLVGSYGIPFKFVDISRSKPQFLAEEMTRRNWNTVPVIFFKRGDENLFLGGYTDLEKILVDA